MTNQEAQMMRQQQQCKIVLLESIAKHYEQAANAFQRLKFDRYNIEIKKAKIIELKICSEFKLWY